MSTHTYQFLMIYLNIVDADLPLTTLFVMLLYYWLWNVIAKLLLNALPWLHTAHLQ